MREAVHPFILSIVTALLVLAFCQKLRGQEDRIVTAEEVKKAARPAGSFLCTSSLTRIAPSPPDGAGAHHR